MTARIGAIVMAALLALYLLLVVQSSFRLIAVDEPVAKVMGVALLVLPLIGFWALGAELLFGWRSGRLERELAAEGGLPDDNLERYPSGRVIDRAAADVVFERYRAEADAAPDSWRAWFRLGLAYDSAGDRRRARHAIRRAIALERESGT
ncbi:MULTISPECIES: hypothetical protein [unclassified Cryobacterium]|uniref:hypothetical protein n=1 Tax=unclassified Cryobacterium TaxID=2649013 RepID=UPI001447EA9F|nr:MULTISPECIES: hypothetical protein [unclassified Cryobacterium]